MAEGRGGGKQAGRAAGRASHGRALISATACSPERIAPSMKDGQTLAVSVPAQCSGPTGSRTAERNNVVAPGVRNLVKQPRVHCCVDQFISWYSVGLSAFGPNLCAISSSTILRRAAAGNG